MVIKFFRAVLIKADSCFSLFHYGDVLYIMLMNLLRKNSNALLFFRRGSWFMNIWIFFNISMRMQERKWRGWLMPSVFDVDVSQLPLLFMGFRLYFNFLCAFSYFTVPEGPSFLRTVILRISRIFNDLNVAFRRWRSDRKEESKKGRERARKNDE